MPNGYTAEIYDGDESFRKYVIRVAKSFGAYYHLREEGLDEPLSKIDDSDVLHYKQSLDNAQTKYDEFTALSEDEQKALWQEDLVRIREANHRAVVRDAELAERYGRMLGKVIVWNVPEELIELKKTMRKYLEESMDFDCGIGPVYQSDEPTFEKWLNDKVASFERDKSYYSERLEKTKKRLAEQHAWHEMLMKALEGIE